MFFSVFNFSKSVISPFYKRCFSLPSSAHFISSFCSASLEEGVGNSFFGTITTSLRSLAIGVGSLGA